LIYFFILFISADRFDTADIGKEATMKLHKILGIALVVALSVTAVAAEAKTSRVNYSKNVFSPERGVICDTYGTAYCADGTGISMSWTEKFLGPKAVTAFAKMTEGGDFDETEFVMSNGVHCKTKINACFTQKNGTEMHEAITQRIWG
jgi:hypothetical protein